MNAEVTPRTIEEEARDIVEHAAGAGIRLATGNWFDTDGESCFACAVGALVAARLGYGRALELDERRRREIRPFVSLASPDLGVTKSYLHGMSDGFEGEDGRLDDRDDDYRRGHAVGRDAEEGGAE